MRTMWVALAVLAVAACAVSAPAFGQGASSSRQTATITGTTTEPGASAGSELAIEWRNPSDPNAKPPSVQTIVIAFPDGTVIDTSVPEQCKATDIELMLRGAAACPTESRIGGGTLITDTGSPGVLPRFGINTLTQFNNKDEIIGLAETESPPTRVVGRSRINDNTITIDVPAVPGGPPDFMTVFRSLRTSTPPIVRGGRAYARTPPSCPSSGVWGGSITFRYRDGVSERVETRAPCRPAPAPACTGPRHRQRSRRKLPLRIDQPRAIHTGGGKRVDLPARAKRPLSCVVLTLRLGRTVYGRSAPLSYRGTRNLRIMLTRRLRAGNYKLIATGRDEAGAPARRTELLRVRRR